MTEMIFPGLVWMSLVVMALPSSPPPPRPTVLLEAPVNAVSRGGPVVLKVIIDNDTLSTGVVYAEFSPAEGAEGPETVLQFTVTGPMGLGVQAGKPAIPRGLRALEAFCSFLEMTPGQFIGMRVDLTGPLYAYAFKEPGVYKVKTRVTFFSRQWLEKRAELEREKLSKEYRALLTSRGLIYDGTVESNEVTIEVR